MRTGDGFPDIVITAVASTTSLAADAEDTWQQLLQGKSGIRPLQKWFIGEFESPVLIGGELTETFDEQLTKVERRRPYSTPDNRWRSALRRRAGRGSSSRRTGR